jgi:hypothetical protein
MTQGGKPSLSVSVPEQCHKTFYHGNLLPSCGNYCSNIVLKHRMTVITWNDGKKFYNTGPRVERLAKDKQPSLSGPFVSYEENELL